MNRESKKKSGGSICPLVTDKRKRKAADRATAAIQGAFPPGVARPALRALASAGYTRLEQLTKAREADLMSLHGMGPKAIGILKDALGKQGKSFLR
jgi:hypothetical protein